jgi:hypothetical protein
MTGGGFLTALEASPSPAWLLGVRTTPPGYVMDWQTIAPGYPDILGGSYTFAVASPAALYADSTTLPVCSAQLVGAQYSGPFVLNCKLTGYLVRPTESHGADE